MAHVIYVNEPKLDAAIEAKNTQCLFATCANSGHEINDAVLFFDQVTGAWILVSTVLALTDPRNANPPGLAPLFIGLSATAVGVAYGGNGG